MSRPFHHEFDPRPVIFKNKGMNKILLVYDDYAELTTVEFSLKKVGFDVIAVSSEFSIQEKLLSFNPEIVIAYGRGPKVTTVGVGKRLKEMSRWNGKALLIFPSGVKPNPEDLIRVRMDLLLEAPVPTVRLIQILAKMTNQDDQVLVEKLIKAAAAESTEAATITQKGKAKEDDKIFVEGKINTSDKGQLVPNSFSKEIVNRVGNTSSFDVNPDVESIGSDPENEKLETPNFSSIDVDEKKSQFMLNPEVNTPSDPSNFNTNRETTSENDGFSIAQMPQRPTDSFQQAKNGPNPQQQVNEARNSLPARTKKYHEFTKKLSLNPKSSLQRSEVRKEQRAMSVDWDKSEHEEQDELRRKFIKGLFKK